MKLESKEVPAEMECGGGGRLNGGPRRHQHHGQGQGGEATGVKEGGRDQRRLKNMDRGAVALGDTNYDRRVKREETQGSGKGRQEGVGGSGKGRDYLK